MGQNEQSVVAAERGQSPPRVDVIPESIRSDSEGQRENKVDQQNWEEKPICRICHCSSEDLEPPSMKPNKKMHICARSDHSKFDLNDPYYLITPCLCTGTLKYVHHMCLQHWIRASNHKYCELCKYNFKLNIHDKPIYKWESLHLSAGERRKLLFQLTFNFISIIFVFWSIYVIAERATYELVGKLTWRFYLKMIVVTIGFICGVLFILFQAKLYIFTIVRWKQYNQIVIIENVSIDQLMSKHTDKALSISIDLTCESK